MCPQGTIPDYPTPRVLIPFEFSRVENEVSIIIRRPMSDMMEFLKSNTS
jgi:hypothetical protein